MRVSGLLLIAALIAAPLIHFVPLMAKHDPSAIFSQFIGCAALIAMAISQVMATRIRIIEPIFGGLDRVYVLHKWLGIAAVVAILLHDTIDAEINGLGRETWLSDLAETLGEFSLYGFIILALITIVTFIPYHLWRWSHKLMGAFFALSAFHFAFISKPFSNTEPVSVYVLLMCAAGLVAYVYTLFPTIFGRKSVPYLVEQTERTGGALTVQLKPVDRAVRHKAGQFSFVSFDLPDLKETHPFTISSAPNPAGLLQFTIKPMGDYTAKLGAQLKPGTKAYLSSAFGHFRLRQSAKGQIWIAGGIGITPFNAWLQEATSEHGNIDLFYCIRGRANAPHLEQIEQAAAKLNNLNLHIVDTSKQSRLSASTIAQSISSDLSTANIYYCGPAPMREALRRDLHSKGVAHRRFHYEEFEIRSGIGVRKIIKLMVQKGGLAGKYPELLGKLA